MNKPMAKPDSAETAPKLMSKKPEANVAVAPMDMMPTRAIFKNMDLTL
jgi:hypothetical protein